AVSVVTRQNLLRLVVAGHRDVASCCYRGAMGAGSHVSITHCARSPRRPGGTGAIACRALPPAARPRTISPHDPPRTTRPDPERTPMADPAPRAPRTLRRRARGLVRDLAYSPPVRALARTVADRPA